MRLLRIEFLLFRRDRSAWTLLAAYTLLASYALWSGNRWAAQEWSAYDRFRAQDEARLLRYQQRAATMERQVAANASGPIPVHEFTWGPRKPNWPTAWAPQSAVLPPGPLADWMTGQRDLHTLAFTGFRKTPSARQAGNPLALLLGPLDFAAVCIYFLPLLIFGLTFNTVIADRESGVWGIVTAQPVSGSQVLAARMALRLIVVGLLHTALIVPATPRRFLWWFAVLAYAVFWTSVAWWLNARGTSSARSALALGGVRLWSLFAAPGLVQWIGSQSSPIPLRTQFVQARRDAVERTQKIPEAEVLADFVHSHPEFDKQNYQGQGRRFMIGHARLEAQEDLLATEERRFNDAFSRQAGTVRFLSFLSPAIPAREIMLVASGSGTDRYGSFLKQLEDFKRETRAYFRPLVFADGEFKSGDYGHIPRFRFREETDSEVINNAASDLVILILWTAACVLLLRR